MLQHLKIENYALIKSLSLTLDTGFTTITGETGAGKSILLGALSLILGKRADTDVLYDAEKKCVVEGRFVIKAYGLESFFEEHELDYDPELILRREVSPSGKSRAFINDTPVKLQQMKELGDQLVDIHSQNKTITLHHADVQLAVIDSLAAHDNLLEDFHTRFREWQRTQNKLEELQEKQTAAKTDEDYYRFLLEEFDKLQLQPDEKEAIEEELDLQNHAEAIKGALSAGTARIKTDEPNILEQLEDLRHRLKKAPETQTTLHQLAERLEAVIIELGDISNTMESLGEDIEYDAQRIDQLTSRINSIYELEQKHRVNNTRELLEKADEISKKLNNIQSLDEDIEETQHKLKIEEQKLIELSEKISSNRSKQVPAIEAEILKALNQMGMPNALFKIEQQILEQLTPDGKDRITFLFSANPGIAPQPISKVASGGEMSRLMLAVKSLIAKQTLIPTLILDEIDSGVSGDIAGKVGQIMKKMARSMQVIAITHLPQIASKSHDHLFVYKQIDNGKTYSHIKKLNNNEKLEAIARMLSDNQLTSAAMEAAREMISKEE